MVESVVARWVVTAAIGSVGLAHLCGLTTGRAVVHRVDGCAHAVTCGALIAVVWPWGSWLPVWPQVALVACAGAWFTARGLVAVGGGEPDLRVAAVPASHAVGGFALVWALVAVGVGAHGRDDPGWPVSFPASVLGLGSLLVAGWWLREACTRGVADRVASRVAVVGHAVLNGGVAVLLFALR
ncbi:DUF5134 domain-containing protein [Actinosynnema sp. NPDC050436]|uniref:DUF5134 domain-containing protein n=1 Tax=Actinosynnema sp. NPDC050436 TaxID=3155659 RepID=UPI0033F1A37D